MKITVKPAALMLFCGLVNAHSLLPANMSAEDQQLLDKTLLQLQQCFSNIDPSEVTALQQRADRFATQLRELCLERKRAEAEKETAGFYTSMMKEPTIKQAEACADKIPEKFEGFVSTPLNLSQFEADDDHHICDREILPLDQYSGHHH